MRGMILITATIVNIDLPCYQSNVSVRSQVDAGNFVFTLTFYICLQQLTSAMAWQTKSIKYSGLSFRNVNVPLFSSCLITQAGSGIILCIALRPQPNGSIHSPPRKAQEKKVNANMNCAPAEHILAMWNVSMPYTLEVEEASFPPLALALFQNHPSSKDTRSVPPSTSRYYCPIVEVLRDSHTSPSFGDARVWTRDHNTCDLVLNPLSYHVTLCCHLT